MLDEIWSTLATDPAMIAALRQAVVSSTVRSSQHGLAEMCRHWQRDPEAPAASGVSPAAPEPAEAWGNSADEPLVI